MALKEYCAEYWLKELQESMKRGTGRRDITEILNTALSRIQSISSERKLVILICQPGNVYGRHLLTLFLLHFVENNATTSLIRYFENYVSYTESGHR